MRRIKHLLSLATVFFIYSISSVFSKYASQFPFLSLKFLAAYGASICILIIYAILWQQLLKKIKLTQAYFGKALTLIFGMMWGYFLFNEPITISMIVGSILISFGLVGLVKSNE